MSTIIDPWVITQREKLKYQVQFKALQPQNGYVTGGQAKGFFLQSQLPPLILGQIWALADTDSDGKMNIHEFSIACKLINLKLRGMEVPKALPPTLLSSLMAVGTTPTMTPTGTGSISPMDPLKTLPAAAAVKQPEASIAATAVSAAVAATTAAAPMIGNSSAASAPISPAVVPPPLAATVLPAAVPPANMTIGVIPTAATNAAVPMQQIPGVVSPASIAAPAIIPGAGVTVIPANIAPSVSTKVASPTSQDAHASVTPQSNPPSRHMSISDRTPSVESPQAEWAVKAPAKRKYTQVFNATDRNRTGYLTGVQARSILVQSRLPQATLAQIWTLADLDCDGRLSCDEFILAMFLCDKAMNGEKVPSVLPPDWIPPSFRKLKSRQGSVSGAGSRSGSQPTSRHASVSSQGASDADPAAGLPQTTFEDKRKENFDKGQAELDRRRKLLQEQQRKEKEERERKEREEAEKREKARLEAERKQQEELERQLQKQRELELEKEEQRKRELEAKEAARKELEKQRLMEWEQARIAELNSQKQREQERVLKQKAHNTQLNIELSTLNEKIKDLSQKICETRAGVTNVKSVIDGMRSQRDSSMSEMSQLKARIKEQNAKLLQLTQERAKWDAKVKAIGASADAAQQEQLNAAFANKQLIIKQLKSKVENICADMEAKKEDINTHDDQVTEVKAELSALIEKCEELYADYDKKRTQVLEMKYNKKNESVSAVSAASAVPAVSAWETSSAWGSDINEIAAESITNVDDTGGPAPEGFVKYKAVYKFTARNTDEISFVPGDIIFVPLEQTAEPGWLAGELNGHTGWFPETYVEKLSDDDATTTHTFITPDAYNDNTREQNQQSLQEPYKSNADTYNGEIEYCIAAYPYESAEAGDLTFTAGEMIIVTKKEGDWWTGTIGQRSGMFPSNYVQKADIGTTTTSSTSAQPLTTTDYDNELDANVNGNANEALTATRDSALIEETQLTTTDIQPVTNDVIEMKHTEQLAAAAADAAAEETQRKEDELDTEVSQINTQSTQKAAQSTTDAGDSSSRPMSRTSTMTPGMRAKRYEIAQVIAPYEATSSEQLSLTRGQLIMVRKKTDAGWWEVELQAKGRRRQIGWFPAAYVKVLQGGRNSGRNTPVSGSRVEMSEQILDKVIALYPYKAQNDDELSFDKNDIISVLGRDEREWWRGELNGLTGLFPSNYVGPFVTSGNI